MREKYTIEEWVREANWNEKTNKLFMCSKNNEDSDSIDFFYKLYETSEIKDEKSFQYSFSFEDVKDINPNLISFVVLEMFMEKLKQNDDFWPKIKKRYASLKNKIEDSSNSFYLEKNLIEAKIKKINKFNEVLFEMNSNRTSFRFSNLSYRTINSNLWREYIFFKIPKENAVGIVEQLVKEEFLNEKKIERLIANGKKERYEYRFNFFANKSKKQIFIISEFNDENNKINMLIKKSLEKESFRTILMNVDHKMGNIDIAIKKYIKESSFIIANLSHYKYWNANVFYELGMAKAWDKDTIMFIKEDQFPSKKIETHLPFDINSHMSLKWKNNTNKNFELVNEILEIIAK